MFKKIAFCCFFTLFSLTGCQNQPSENISVSMATQENSDVANSANENSGIKTANTENTIDTTNLIATAVQGSRIEPEYFFIDFENGILTDREGKKIEVFSSKMREFFQKNESFSSDAFSHPENSDMFFFSTQDYEDKDSFTTVDRIYAYDLKSSKLIKILEKQNISKLDSENDMDPSFFLIGMEGSKLIVLHSGIDNDHLPCPSVWNTEYQYSFLELANIQAGFQPYIVPAYKLQEHKKEVEKCIEEFEKRYPQE